MDPFRGKMGQFEYTYTFYGVKLEYKDIYQYIFENKEKWNNLDDFETLKTLFDDYENETIQEMFEIYFDNYSDYEEDIRLLNFFQEILYDKGITLYFDSEQYRDGKYGFQKYGIYLCLQLLKTVCIRYWLSKPPNDETIIHKKDRIEFDLFPIGPVEKYVFVKHT